MANKALASRQRHHHRVEPSQRPARFHTQAGRFNQAKPASRFTSTRKTTMFETAAISERPDYALLSRQLASILDGETHLMTNAAQLSAFIYHTLSDLNWAGFYFCQPAKSANSQQPVELLLGAFQGKVACVRIPFGRGVCGTAAATRQTQLVADVHEFPGHIACDSASNSEIVLPLLKDGKLYGVLDLDSPLKARFTSEDQAGLQQLVDIFMAATDFSSLPAV